MGFWSAMVTRAKAVMVEERPESARGTPASAGLLAAQGPWAAGRLAGRRFGGAATQSNGHVALVPPDDN